MSIIERFADLLGSESQRPQKPSSAGDGRRQSTHDLIERAAGDIGRRAIPHEAPIPAVESRTVKPAHSAGKPARTYKVDRERLRRQSMITPDGERTAIAESFRRIKRQILMNVASPKSDALPANLMLVTSALPGEGKTYCAINVAISIALEMDRTVLLVDGDVAKPSIPQVLGLDAAKGLMDVLIDRRIDIGDVLMKVDIGKLTLMPVGTPHKHATELLASEAMRRLLRELVERYHDRIIIFDSPPLLAASEAGVLATHVGQIVVVVEAGKTSEAELKGALSHIDVSKVTGLLLNKGEGAPLAYGYGYGGYG